MLPDRADVSCVLAMVRRLSEERARRVQGRGDLTVVKLRAIVPGELASRRGRCVTSQRRNEQGTT